MALKTSSTNTHLLLTKLSHIFELHGSVAWMFISLTRSAAGQISESEKIEFS